jgi:hypothetical protein
LKKARDLRRRLLPELSKAGEPSGKLFWTLVVELGEVIKADFEGKRGWWPKYLARRTGRLPFSLTDLAVKHLFYNQEDGGYITRLYELREKLKNEKPLRLQFNKWVKMQYLTKRLASAFMAELPPPPRFISKQNRARYLDLHRKEGREFIEAFHELLRQLKGKAGPDGQNIKNLDTLLNNESKRTAFITRLTEALKENAQRSGCLGFLGKGRLVISAAMIKSQMAQIVQSFSSPKKRKRAAETVVFFNGPSDEAKQAVKQANQSSRRVPSRLEMGSIGV